MLKQTFSLYASIFKNLKQQKPEDAHVELKRLFETSELYIQPRSMETASYEFSSPSSW